MKLYGVSQIKASASDIRVTEIMNTSRAVNKSINMCFSYHIDLSGDFNLPFLYFLHVEFNRVVFKEVHSRVLIKVLFLFIIWLYLLQPALNIIKELHFSICCLLKKCLGRVHRDLTQNVCFNHTKIFVTGLERIHILYFSICNFFKSMEKEHTSFP